MEELLAEQSGDIRSLKHGDVVEGTIVRIDKDEMLVDVGAKSEGVVSNRELYGRNAETQPELSVGDTVLVYVLQPESTDGHAVLSLRRAGLERKWRSMQEQFDAGEIIEAPVIDHNKGGLIVDCGIRGFVPISQIVDFPRRPQNDQPRDAAQEIAEKLQPYVGRKLRLKILEVNRKANRLILSEKVALYEERREKRDELFSSLQVGQQVTGTVRSIAPFGVFIDLGGIDGLVHKSELSWNKVNNPEARLRGRRRGRGRGHRHQPRAWPHQPVHPTHAARPVAAPPSATSRSATSSTARSPRSSTSVPSCASGRPRGPHPHQRALAPARRPSGRRGPRGPDAQAQDHLARLRAASPGPQPQAGRGGAGPSGAARRVTAPTAPGALLRYDRSQAVQEPEGGIDNTLAAAFAQVRQQIAEQDAAGPMRRRGHRGRCRRRRGRGRAEAEVEEAIAAEAVAEIVEARSKPSLDEAVACRGRGRGRGRSKPRRSRMPPRRRTTRPDRGGSWHEAEAEVAARPWPSRRPA